MNVVFLKFVRFYLGNKRIEVKKAKRKTTWMIFLKKRTQENKKENDEKGERKTFFITYFD